MANLPLLLSLADDLASAPFYESPFYYIRRPAAYLTLANAAEQARSGDKSVALSGPTIGKDGFQVCMDVKQFKPNELNVKVVDNSVIVEGKHEEREDDHGYISRHFVRRYALPKGYDPNKVVSTLSSDGVLSVNVPKPQIEDKSKEVQIQIQQVGPAHLNVKENPKIENEEEIYKRNPTNLDDLKQSIPTVIEAIPAAILRAVINNFLIRCRTCVTESGGHLNSIIFKTS